MVGRTYLVGSADLPAVLRPHFAGVRVQNTVATAGRLGTTPARFTTMSCGLAVLLICTHDALAANGKSQNRFAAGD